MFLYEVRCSLGLRRAGPYNGHLAHVTISDSKFKMDSSGAGVGVWQKYEISFLMSFSTAFIMGVLFSVKGENCLIKYPVGV